MAGISIGDRSLGHGRRNTSLDWRVWRTSHAVLLASIVVAAAFGVAYGVGALTSTKTLGPAPAPAPAVAAQSGAVRIVGVRSAPAVPALKVPPRPRHHRAAAAIRAATPAALPSAATTTPLTTPTSTPSPTPSVPISAAPVAPVAAASRPVTPAPVTRTTPSGAGTRSSGSGVVSGGG